MGCRTPDVVVVYRANYSPILTVRIEGNGLEERNNG